MDRKKCLTQQSASAIGAKCLKYRDNLPKISELPYLFNAETTDFNHRLGMLKVYLREHEDILMEIKHWLRSVKTKAVDIDTQGVHFQSFCDQLHTECGGAMGVIGSIIEKMQECLITLHSLECELQTAGNVASPPASYIRASDMVKWRVVHAEERFYDCLSNSYTSIGYILNRGLTKTVKSTGFGHIY